MIDSTESNEQDNSTGTSEQTQEQVQDQPQEQAQEQSQDQSAPSASLGPIDEPVYLSTPEAIAINSEQGGDSRVASADSDSSGAIPVDNSPRPSVDVSAQYPWQLGVTGIYRNLNIAQIRSLHLDFGHEPSIQLSIDPSGKLTAQSAITLVNLHWMPPWNREVEVGLSGLVNTTILPRLSAQYGGQLQAEQHIVDWFSITLSASGGWTPGTSGQPGKFELTGAAGAVIHFDGL
jgi:hypothetical protein